jgi:hypothetical protein
MRAIERGQRMAEIARGKYIHSAPDIILGDAPNSPGIPGARIYFRHDKIKHSFFYHASVNQ